MSMASNVNGSVFLTSLHRKLWLLPLKMLCSAGRPPSHVRPFLAQIVDTPTVWHPVSDVARTIINRP